MLPDDKWGKRAELLLDTYALNGPEDEKKIFEAGKTVTVQARSLRVLRYLKS